MVRKPCFLQNLFQRNKLFVDVNTCIFPAAFDFFPFYWLLITANNFHVVALGPALRTWTFLKPGKWKIYNYTEGWSLSVNTMYKNQILVLLLTRMFKVIILLLKAVLKMYIITLMNRHAILGTTYCTVNSLYCGHPQDHDLASLIARVRNNRLTLFQPNSVIYFCWRFSCCPYHQGVHNSEVFAKGRIDCSCKRHECSQLNIIFLPLQYFCSQKWWLLIKCFAFPCKNYYF